jgi:hypothetical protein
MKLGDEVRDKITGYTGITIAHTNWLNGCSRWVVQSEQLEKGLPVTADTIDEVQLIVVTPGKFFATPPGPAGDREDAVGMPATR